MEQRTSKLLVAGSSPAAIASSFLLNCYWFCPNGYAGADFRQFFALGHALSLLTIGLTQDAISGTDVRGGGLR